MTSLAKRWHSTSYAFTRFIWAILTGAQEYAEGAIRCYRQGDAVFGSLHLHAHLGQIKLMRGDLDGAASQYAEMQERLDRLPDDTSALLAICRTLRSEVAYETNDLVQSSTLLSHAMGSVEEEDAWLDVRAAAYRVRDADWPISARVFPAR